MIKDTDGHLDGRDAYGKVCGKRCGASVPSAAMPPSQDLHMFINRTFFEPCTFGIFMEAS